MTQILSSLRSVLNISPPRITFVRSGALGDSILLLPTIHLLQRENPDAEMQIIGSTWARRIIPLVPHDWSFAPYGSPDMTRLFTDQCRVLPPIIEDSDGVIIYTSSPDGPLASNIRELHSGATIIHPIAPSPNTHTAAHLASAVTEDSPRVQELPHPALQAPSAAQQRAADRIDRLRTSDRPTVLLHPGSGSKEKCWPPRLYADLAEKLDQRGVNTVGLQGPADKEQCRRVSHAYPSLKFIVKSDLDHVAGILSAVSACVTNDSGIGHLSAALQSPTISIFGPTSPHQWRPLGPCTTVLRSNSGEDWPEPRHVMNAIMRSI